MSSDRELVNKISKLSRLKIDESDIDIFVKNFKDILEYIDLLSSVDTNSEKTQDTIQKDYAVRDDTTIDKLSNDEVLLNAIGDHQKFKMRLGNPGLDQMGLKNIDPIKSDPLLFSVDLVGKFCSSSSLKTVAKPALIISFPLSFPLSMYSPPTVKDRPPSTESFKLNLFCVNILLISIFLFRFFKSLFAFGLYIKDPFAVKKLSKNFPLFFNGYDIS